MPYKPVTIVHSGIGLYSSAHDSTLKASCAEACKRASALLKQGGSALSGVEAAISYFEGDPNLNVGVGSSTTIDGTVECDASVVDAKSGRFGSVGAVPGIKHPIKLARIVCDRSNGVLPLGRVPPCVLSGDGALRYAEILGYRDLRVDPLQLTTAKTLKQHRRYMSWLTETGDDECAAESDKLPCETVGAVCLDKYGEIASGVASGGIWLKYPGRIGHAGIPGAGCWSRSSTSTSSECTSVKCGDGVFESSGVDESEKDCSRPLGDGDIRGSRFGCSDDASSLCSSSNRGVGISLSGRGEALISTMAARSLTNAVYESVHEHPADITQNFLANAADLDNQVGFVGLATEDGHCELIWGHTRGCFALAHQYGGSPVAQVSRLVHSDKYSVCGFGIRTH